MSNDAGAAIRAERTRRRWPLRKLADRAGISTSHLQAIESGEPASLDVYARAFTALGLRPILAPEPRASTRRPDEDFVHAAMGELESARLLSFRLEVRLDEPYQHYQFAGRGDVVAWDPAARDLLHIENRTQFPNVQEALGTFGAKRAYLPSILAERIGLGANGWMRTTNVVVALWSSEVLHVLRLRRATFRAACPDPAEEFLQWWNGARATSLPATRSSSTLVLMDPGSVREPFRFIGLDAAMTARPRYRDYATAAEALRRG